MLVFLGPESDRTLTVQFVESRSFNDPGEISESSIDFDGIAREMTYEELFSGGDLPIGQYVFTGLNRLSVDQREALSSAWDQISAATGLEPLNHPLLTMDRHRLLETLHEHGINRFRSFGAWGDLQDLKYPAFVKHRSRDGGAPGLLTSARQVDRAIGQMLFDGVDVQDILVVEFADTSDEQGFFRKFSAFVMKDRVLPFSMDYGREWVLRRICAEYTLPSVNEELVFMRENPHADQLQEVFRLSNTEFGRIDYSVENGKVQIWEINTLPMLRMASNSTPVPPDLKILRKERKELFRQRFRSALFALSDNGKGEGTFRISWDPGSPSGFEDRLTKPAGSSALDSGPKLGLLRSMLRPLKPLLKPVSDSVLLPALARRARAKNR